MTLCDSVDDAMADLAMVFHWAPRDMDNMGISELLEWRERARKRHEGSNPKAPSSPGRKPRKR